MRQWNIDPKLLCNQHLLGEHVEHHMFIGCIEKNMSLDGYIDKGLVEIHNLETRHNELAEEMKKRRMKHSSPLPIVNLYIAGNIDINKNIKELKRRCPECKKLIKEKNYENLL